MKVVRCLKVPIIGHTTLVFDNATPRKSWRKLKYGETVLEPVFTSGLKDNMVTVSENIDITGAEVEFIW